MSGKRELGQCGHVVEYVFNQFAVCTEKTCDGRMRCPKCGSTDVAPFKSEMVPPGSFHCWTKGHVWRPGF